MSTVENEGKGMGAPFPKIEIQPYGGNLRPTTRPGFYEVCGDPVNHPSHYNQYEGFEVIDLTEQMNFNLGNVVKYVTRAGFKSPETEVQDLKKAVWYLEREIKRLEKK